MQRIAGVLYVCTGYLFCMCMKLSMGDFQCSFKITCFYEQSKGDARKRKTFADGTDELPKHAKNEGFGPEMAAQFDEVIIQTKSTRAEIQPPTKTHDDDSAATTATSEEAGAEWHEEFGSFKQQTQEKFEERAQEIHDLEQLIRNSDKNQQDQTKKLAKKTLEVLRELQETQAKISHSVTKIDENSSGMKEAIEQLRTKQEIRHGEILDELKRMNDKIPAIKSQIQQGSQVSQEPPLVRLEPSQVKLIATQLKEELQN